MKKWGQLVFFVALAALTCGGTCYLVIRTTHRQERRDPVENHYWIHQQLKITPEQEQALEPVEKKFERERIRLSVEIQQGNRELAEAIRVDKTESPRVRDAIARIHKAQGELQNAVIQHVFDMKAILTPVQYHQLIQLTAEALDHTPAAE